MWVAAAPTNGPIRCGNEARAGTPTVPPSARNTCPAAYALSAYMAPLKIRCWIRGTRRRLNALTKPTVPAPTGPTRTTEARVAAYPGDQASREGRIAVGVDSQTRNRTARTATWVHSIPVNGPFPTRAAVAMTTAPMLNHDAW